MSKRSGFFEGILLGAIVGAIIGLLFAPQSGEETRDKIKTIADDSDDPLTNASDKTDDLIDKTRQAIEQGFEKLNGIIAEGKVSGTGSSDVSKDASGITVAPKG